MIDWTEPNALRLQIETAGLSVERFSQLSGVSRTQMFRLCAGVNKPRWDTQRKIEAAFEKLHVPKRSKKHALKRDVPQSANKTYTEGHMLADRKAAA